VTSSSRRPTPRAGRGAGSGRDVENLSRALVLARKGLGTTSPNPMVGAVVVRSGRVVGSGFHRRAGSEHAEVVALRQAGQRARGATLYVNLEPCAHHGRTPPCVDAIRASGIRRLVTSMIDPNPLVRGRGLADLRRAGVIVSCGLLAAEARLVNEAYVHFMRTGVPFVILKAGMSLDGRIASRTGASRWITSTASRRGGQALRWACDAIAVGVDTVRADDPMLTARRGGRVKPGFLRVILDSRLRTPPGSRLVTTARRHPTCIFTTRNAPATRQRRLEDAGVTVECVASVGGRVALPRVLSELARRDVQSLLVEGGGEVHGAFLERGHVDKLVFFLAPLLLGGRRSVPVVGGVGAASPAEAWGLKGFRIEECGPDLRLEGYPVRRGGH
jgi:diaminohydroxyphosphoribosylaminopyrimidine deaminase / 5-amino-6-(5-phosphoribosylamino)uracil reductase